MRIAVDAIPKKKEECFFYRKEIHYDNTPKEYCALNNKECSFKRGDSIFGGECRCLYALMR